MLVYSIPQQKQRYVTMSGVPTIVVPYTNSTDSHKDSKDETWDDARNKLESELTKPKRV